jgi:hypothetical protein
VSAPLAKLSVAYWNFLAQTSGSIPALPTGLWRLEVVAGTHN